VTRVKELIDQRDRMSAPLPSRGETAASVAAGNARPTAAPSPAPEPPAAASAEPAKSGRPESSTFLRVAPRGGEAMTPVPEAAPVLESLELPTAPLWDGAAQSMPSPMRFQPLAPLTPLTPVPVPQAPPPAAAAPAPAAPPRVTLANAFTALLAAEQSTQPVGAAASAISEASIEDAVRRVLVRMTDELVRRIVLDTAERLIREEIERIKANPD
jgi:hypothetical protein